MPAHHVKLGQYRCSKVPSHICFKQVTCTARLTARKEILCITIFGGVSLFAWACVTHVCTSAYVREDLPTRNGPLSTQSFIGASHATGSRPSTYSRRQELHLHFCSAHCQSVCPSRAVVVGVASRQSRSRCLKVLHRPAPLMRKHCDTQEAEKRETRVASQLEHRPAYPGPAHARVPDLQIRCEP